MNGGEEHWQTVFTTKAENEVSWYQPQPTVSLEMIAVAAPDKTSAIVDIGGGASTLADALIDRGYSDITVLDISEAALARSRARLGDRASTVDWVVADVTAWTPKRQWQVWHDRAAFHFLTDTERQDAYIAALTRATAPGAAAIIATFALDGPERCSGLPVQRYSPQTLADRLRADFELVSGAAENHITPAGAVQRFSYTLLRRR
jgi:SAM-dependent methyltransferase